MALPMHNFLGTMQLTLPMGPAGGECSIKKSAECISVRGRASSQEDALQQLKDIYREKHANLAKYVDDHRYVQAGVFVFDGTVADLIKEAADVDTVNIIRKWYEDSVELDPLE